MRAIENSAIRHMACYGLKGLKGLKLYIVSRKLCACVCYREFSNTSYGVLWAERVEVVYCKQEGVCVCVL